MSLLFITETIVCPIECDLIAGNFEVRIQKKKCFVGHFDTLFFLGERNKNNTKQCNTNNTPILSFRG